MSPPHAADSRMHRWWLAVLALLVVFVAVGYGWNRQFAFWASNADVHNFVSKASKPGRDLHKELSLLPCSQRSLSALVVLLGSQNEAVARGAIRALNQQLDRLWTRRTPAACRCVIALAEELAVQAEDANLPLGAVEQLSLRLMQWPLLDADGQIVVATRCATALRTTGVKSRP